MEPSSLHPIHTHGLPGLLVYQILSVKSPPETVSTWRRALMDKSSLHSMESHGFEGHLELQLISLESPLQMIIPPIVIVHLWQLVLEEPSLPLLHSPMLLKELLEQQKISKELPTISGDFPNALKNNHYQPKELSWINNCPSKTNIHKRSVTSSLVITTNNSSPSDNQKFRENIWPVGNLVWKLWNDIYYFIMKQFSKGWWIRKRIQSSSTTFPYSCKIHQMMV